MIPQNYSLSRDKINNAKNKEELSEAIAFSVEKSNEFSESQNETLKELIENKSNILRVSEQYNEIDKENFKPIEIIETNIDGEKQKDKRTPKVKEPQQNTYRVKRRVNKPIEWVQYSNNEYEVEVSSTDKETLLSRLDDIEREVIQRLSLYNKDALEAYWKKKYDEWVASVKPVVTQANVNTFEYDMSQVNLVNEQYAVARYQRLNNFVLQAFEKFPEVKKFYDEFSKSNPKVEAPNL